MKQPTTHHGQFCKACHPKAQVAGSAYRHIQRSFLHNHDVRLGIALGLVAQLLFVLPLLALAAVSLHIAILTLFLILTGVIGGILVLSVEWKGIWNLRRVEEATLGDIEFRRIYLPTMQRIAVTLLLTVIMPVTAWQAGAEVYEQVGNGAFLGGEEGDDSLHEASSGATLSPTPQRSAENAP